MTIAESDENRFYDYLVTYDVERYVDHPRDGGWFKHVKQKAWCDEATLNKMLLDPHCHVRVVLKVLEWRAQSVETLRQWALKGKVAVDRAEKLKELDRKQAALDAERERLGAPLSPPL